MKKVLLLVNILLPCFIIAMEVVSLACGFNWARYLALGLSEYDSDILISEKYISDYYDEVLALTNSPKETANWVMTDVLRVFNESPECEFKNVISAENLAKIIKLILSKDITRVNSKVLFEEAYKTGKDVNVLVKELGLVGDVAESDIVAIIDDLIANKPTLLDDYKLEPNDIINFVIGNIMRVTKGKAKVDKIRPLIISKLEK